MLRASVVALVLLGLGAQASEVTPEAPRSRGLRGQPAEGPTLQQVLSPGRTASQERKAVDLTQFMADMQPRTEIALFCAPLEPQLPKGLLRLRK
eukprot:CAMPEP_0184327148 /NCGR_PEP_ID=MMETSP1049-20130417/142869_1 /TAXON_ID=77928 /ORGANISM="Proteomonas sulcata, Strain CCMP704" /LENGTH=93 /DNA_ID=CAMNT_0026649385 /DNA_START=470 /DNA_END=751 /DNA_ORIENTATION=+